jgi:hypothetical protein
MSTEEILYNKKLSNFIKLLYDLEIDYISILEFTKMCKHVFKIEHKTIEEVVIDLELVITNDYIIVDKDWIFEKYVKISTT